MQLKVIKQNCNRIVSFNIIIKMQNANRMKPINVTNQSDLQPNNIKSNNIQTVNVLPLTKLESNIKRTNKNLLEKYSFQDNDLSKSQDDISMNDDIYPLTKQNDNDWLQLSVKQITLFSRQLIVIFLYFIRQTFYLQIQYTIIYNQSPNQQILSSLQDNKTLTKNNKNQLNEKNPPKQNDLLNFKQVRHVRSKLVHGSILQNEGKHLILSLKAKNVPSLANNMHLNEGLKVLKLSEVQFSLIRVYQTTKQGKILCRQVIQNPIVNKEYSIDFWQDKSDSTQKQRPIGTMLFELFSAITQQPLAKKIYQQQAQSQYYIVDDSQILQDISQNKNSARVVGYQNYTLGVPRKQQKENSRNVFDDNQSQQDMSKVQLNSHRSRVNNQSQSNNQRFKYQSEVSQTKQNALVYKLNEMTRIADDNMSKSKNDGYSQKQYLTQNTQILDRINDKTNSRSKNNKKVINMNDTSNVNDTKLSRMKQKHVIKTQNDYTYVENDTQSRFQGNTTTNQRQNYLQTLQYSKYVNQQIVLKKGSPEISPITPSTPNDNFKKRSENKVKQVQTSKTPKFQQNKNDSQQKVSKPKQIKTSKNNKQQNLVSPFSQRVQNDQQNISQDHSQWLLQNLPDMDSSNIRYKFDDNDISNIEETNNMQQLINQIQKIQKQWYQKRVLNRQSNSKSKIEKSQNKNNNNKDIQEQKKMRQQSRLENNNDFIDLELRKFKIKLDESTFYNKLIGNLKNKHNINQTRSKADQKKTESAQNNKKDQSSNRLPKDYIVYLIAHEVNEESMSSPSSAISQKIHIKIPSSQIQDLIKTEKNQSEQNLSLKDQIILPKPKSNEPSNITSQNIRKKIIKDFQKQLSSKVMKIKLINPKQKLTQNNHISQKNKNVIPQKSKTKIIQIALEQECSSLSGQLDSLQKDKNQDPNKKNERDLKNSKINENRISLIGMYPLPVMGLQNKGQQATFYQNISSEPLQITIYNMKTGNQQGRLCFELKKGKVDKEIQTFEQLDDLNQNYMVQKRTKSQLKSYKNLPVKIQEKEKSLKSHSIKIGTPQANLQSNVNSQVKTAKEKQLKIDVNFQSKKQKNPSSSFTNKNNNNKVQTNANKQSLVNNQPKKFQNLSKPVQNQVQQNKELKLALNGPQIKRSNNKNYQLQIYTDSSKPQKDNNLDIRQNIKSRLLKQHQVNQRLQSPHAGKIIKNTGLSVSPKRQITQWIQSQQGRMGKFNIQHNINRKGFTERLNDISINLPQSQRLFPPLINMAEQQRQLQSHTQVKKSKDRTSKNSNRIKTEENPRIYINSKNKNYQDRNQQESSSYRLMKKQLQETAGLLENLKMKAQDFINKVERQKRSETKNNYFEQTQSMKQKPNKFMNSQNDNSQIDKKQFSERQRKASQLQVRSSVISQTVLSNKNKKINQIYNHNKLMAGNNQKNNNIRDLNKNNDEDEYSEQDTPYITQKYSVNSKMLKDRIKRSIKLKQAGDYQFDTLSYDLNKGKSSRQTNQTPIKAIKGQLFSKEEKKLISVEFYSMKIKFLEVNNPQNKKSQGSKLNNSQDYFVKIHSDINKNKERSKQYLLSYKQSSPFIQRCYKSPQLTDKNLYVQFPLIKSKDSQTKPTLCLQGKQSSHIIIQLHNSFQQHLKQEMKRNDQSYLNHDQHPIDLVTSSPKAHASSQPIGTLSVTFLQLMAQDSFQFKTENDLRHKKSTIINYSNFLYNGQKIIGKININYAINLQQKNDNQIHKKRNSYDQPHVFLNLHGSMPRQSFTSGYQNQNPSQINQFYNKHEKIEQNMSNISTFKNTNQIKFKNSLLARYNENLSLFQRDHEEIRKLRSQSGMTKKVSPRRKKIKQNKIHETDKNSEQSRLVDPLEILKRRGPKPLKLQQKIKSHSQSHHVRLSRPFQTPMNKRAKDQFDSLNSSSSLHFNRQKTTENHSQIKNSGVSSNQVQIYPGRFLQTSQKSQQQKNQHKKDKSSQIRRKKNTKELKSYNIQSRIYPTEQTRLSQIKKYDGGNIKFGKSSRFNVVDSPQIAANFEKADFPGPGHYEVRSIFDRHTKKEP